MKSIHREIDSYTNWINLKPSADTYILRSRAYAFLGNHKQAAEDLKKAIQLEPKHADAHNHMAIMMIHQGDYNQAHKYARLSHQMDPNMDDLAWMVAAEALRLTQKIKEKPSAALYHKRGLLALHQGAFVPAKADLEVAARLDPNLDTAFIGLATAYMKLNQPGEAERVLDDIADRKTEFKSDLILRVKQWVHLERKAKHSPSRHTYEELLKFLRAENSIHTLTHAEEIEEQLAAKFPIG